MPLPRIVVYCIQTISAVYEDSTRSVSGESQFWKSLGKFRQEQELETAGIEPEVFADVRDSSPGL